MLSDDELKYFGELLKRRERETMEQLLVCSDSAKPASLDDERNVQILQWKK